MTPDSMANEVEEQKLLLKQYLGQYYYAKMKKKQLELQYVKESLENHSKKCSKQKRNTVILT